ncbi:MAG: AMP-binding protein, partial [bacterium]|nr:AMP-binding protein [bacterium]
KAAKKDFVRIEAVEKREYYPLSSAQKRIYLLHRMVPDSIAYNMPVTFPLGKDIDRAAFERAVEALIARHESFRTSFFMKDEELVQRIHDVTIGDRVREGFSDASDSFVKPFELDKAPLLRMELVEKEAGDFVLLLDMHHIISDGLSQEIMIREFGELYAGQELPPLKVQYKDYSLWEQGETHRLRVKKQEEFWLEQCSGELPLLEIAADFPRPRMQSFEGASVSFMLSPRASGKLQQLAETTGATVFMLILAAITTLLSRLSGQEDIIIGTPTAGRRHADLQGIIGMFVNTLALRNQPTADKPFAKFLDEVKTGTVDAFDNQDYQFEDIVELVSVPGDTGRNPIFDIMFSLQTADTTQTAATTNSVASAGAKDAPADVPAATPESDGEFSHVGVRSAKFDITFSALHAGDRFRFSLEYCSVLFKKGTMERFARYLKAILTEIGRSPATCLGAIDILSDAEKRDILNDFNSSNDYAAEHTLDQLFYRQVEKTPDNIALTFTPGSSQPDQQLTYRQLNERADQLAHQLVRHGACNFIGLLTEPSLDMIIGILGILKVGCAYVPLNPHAPAGRNSYMLKECNARLLLTNLEPDPGISFTGRTLQFRNLVSGASSVSDGREDAAVETPIEPSSPAYVIFTSGSTGEPKGVVISHRNLSPLLHWYDKELEIGPGRRVLRNLSYFFDWSVLEMFITLTGGAQLAIVADEILHNPAACIDFIKRTNVDVLNATPTQYGYLCDEELHSLRYLFLGAEKLSLHMLRRSFD